MVLKQWGLNFDQILFFNEHEGTRTPDPQNRNLMLYPTELHALVGFWENKAKNLYLIKIRVHKIQ